MTSLWRSALALVVVVAGCEGTVDATDPATPANVAGKFTGPFTNGRSPGSYTATLTLTQNGRTLSGSFTSNDNNIVSQVSGEVDKVRITATFSSSGVCPYTMTAVIDAIQNVTVLVGTYTTVDCVGSYTGGFSLTKQP
jgi:hypothetical protein